MWCNMGWQQQRVFTNSWWNRRYKVFAYQDNGVLVLLSSSCQVRVPKVLKVPVADVADVAVTADVADGTGRISGVSRNDQRAQRSLLQRSRSRSRRDRGPTQSDTCQKWSQAEAETERSYNHIDDKTRATNESNEHEKMDWPLIYYDFICPSAALCSRTFLRHCCYSVATWWNHAESTLFLVFIPFRGNHLGSTCIRLYQLYLSCLVPS